LLSPIATTIAHRNCAAILPSIALLPPLSIATVSPPLPIAAATVHCDCNAAHRDCVVVPLSIATQPPMLIAIVLPPLLSPIAATAIHGDCHHNCAAVPPSIALPPLLPIVILLPPLPSTILTHSVTHHHHRHPSQSSHHLAIHFAVAVIVHCNFAAIVPHFVTSLHAATPQCSG
jgi:hypothetical protein